MAVQDAGYQHVGGQILSQEQFVGGGTASGQHQYAGGALGPVAGVPTVPTFSSAPQVTGTPKVGDALAFTSGVSSGNPSPTVTYRWRLNGTPVGSDNTPYVPQSADIGAIPSVRQTAVNTQGSVTSDSPNGPAIVAASGPTTAPTITTAPAINGTPTVGTAASYTAGTYGGGAATSTTIQWRLDGVAIAGATSPTYTPVQGDIGHALTVAETKSNSAGSTTANVSPPVTVVAGSSTADSRPRFGVGPAAYDGPTLDALFATMTATGSNGDKAMASFNVAPNDGTHFGWVAIEAGVSAQGVTFRNPGLETGGWQGAGVAGNNGADNGSSPNTSTITRVINGVSFRFFRQSYGGAPGDFTTV